MTDRQTRHTHTHTQSLIFNKSSSIAGPLPNFHIGNASPLILLCYYLLKFIFHLCYPRSRWRWGLAGAVLFWLLHDWYSVFYSSQTCIFFLSWQWLLFTTSSCWIGATNFLKGVGRGKKIRKIGRRKKASFSICYLVSVCLECLGLDWSLDWIPLKGWMDQVRQESAVVSETVLEASLWK